MTAKEHATQIHNLTTQFNEAVKAARDTGLVVEVLGLLSTTGALTVSILAPVEP